MRNDHYPVGSVRALLQTDLVNQPTSIVLKGRLEKKKTMVPVFFDEKAFEILTAVCLRLIPQDRLKIIDLPGLLDQHLCAGSGNGWRYNQMPAGNVVYKTGLYGINDTAELLYNKEFIVLEEEEQDIVLRKTQAGLAEGKTWEKIPARLFFEALLAVLSELYYSHPLAKEEIGEVAFADAGGWQKIGLNELEAYEPLSLNDSADAK